MDAARWDAIVARRDAEARENPDAYRRKVTAFAALGYVYIFGVLLVLLAVIATIGYVAIERPILVVKLGIPLAAFGLVILRSMWVRIPPPDGLELSRKDAPELWRLVDELRDKVDGPKVKKLLVDDELNASVVQIPRLGIFGWQRNYLTVGLPLMQALSPDEFASVIAHELGHLSKSHGRFGTKVYRLQEIWARLLTALEERRSLGSFIFTKFFEWYAPAFAAYTFPVRRAHEYEADLAAAEATSPQAAARALVGLTAADAYLNERFWPGILRRADSEGEPPAQTFSVLARELTAARGSDDARKWLRTALRAESDTVDTHPALSQRIDALGVEPGALQPSMTETETAAERYLGERAGMLTSQFDADWQRSVLPAWRHEHRTALAERDKLDQLDRDAERGELEVEGLRERAALTERFRGDDDALARWTELGEREPDDVQASFHIGRLLLARGDASGLRHLDRAMERDPDAVLPACELAYAFLVEHDREEDAERYRKRAEGQLDLLGAAAEERAEISEEDELSAPDLPEELIETVRTKVARHQEVAKAYLVRKRLRHLDDEYPLYVIGVIPKHRWRTLWKDADDDNEAGSLADRVADALDLPVDFHVVVPGPRSNLDERFEQVDGALLFSRDD